MAYFPISGIVPSIPKDGDELASGYYLKGYQAGGVTPLSMGTDSVPTSTLAKCLLSTRGEPLSNPLDNETTFIPHFNKDYRLALYTNATDADNNTIASAVWITEDLKYIATASEINISVNGLTRNIQAYLEDKEVAGYGILRTNLAAGDYAAGDVVHVTDDGIAYQGIVGQDSGGGDAIDNDGSVITASGGTTVDGELYWKSIDAQNVHGEYYIDQFGSDFDTGFTNLVNFLRTQENTGASSGGNIKLNHAPHSTSGSLNIFNDMIITGHNFASKVTLADSSDSHMIEFAETNKSRISFDRLWIDGNSSNQTGNYRGVSDGGFEAFQWNVGVLHIHNCGSAGLCY